MFKNIFYLIIVFFVSLVQINFIIALPSPFNFLNIILSAIIFLVILVDYNKGLWFAFMGGIIADLYSPLFFGSISISLLGTAMAINLIFNNLFTNKSIYSLVVLGITGTIINFLIVTIFNFTITYNYFNANYMYYLIWQILLNTLFLIMVFSIINFTTKKFKSVFLVSG